MSLSGEIHQPQLEADEIFRREITRLISYEAGNTISLPNEAEKSLPPQIFLGGQLETDSGEFLELSIINSNSALGRVINLDYDGDRYIVTGTKIFNVEDPLKDLGEAELESLVVLFKNPEILWDKGHTAKIIRCARRDRVELLASKIVVEDISL